MLTTRQKAAAYSADSVRGSVARRPPPQMSAQTHQQSSAWVVRPRRLDAPYERRRSYVLHAVIMAGGGGTRFWPLSRQARPKQALPLLGGTGSMVARSVDRLQPLFGGRGILS